MRKKTGFLLLFLLLTALLAQAGADGTIQNLTAEPSGTTSLYVSWDAAGTGEPLYTVTCRAEATDRTTERRTYLTEAGIHYLSPGEPYVITVSTADGRTATLTVTMPSPPLFTEFGYQLLGTGVYRSAANETNYSEALSTTAAALEGGLADQDTSFLLRFMLNATRDQKYLDFQLVLRLPNGDVYTLPDVLVYDGGQTTIAEYYVFDSALKKVLRDYGALPAGEYRLSAYLNDAFAGDAVFTVE